MMFFGIDPGSIKMGWGVIDDEGNYVHSGVIKASGNNIQRAAFLHRELIKLFARYHQIDAIGIEEPFITAKVSNSALVLTGGFWAASIAAASCGIPVFTAKPATIKKLATGHILASKDQMVAMAQFRFDVMKLTDHQADALFAAVHGKWAFLTAAGQPGADTDEDRAGYKPNASRRVVGKLSAAKRALGKVLTVV